MATSLTIDSWCSWLRVAGRRPGTIALRSRQVRQVLRDLNAEPSDVTEAQLLGWLSQHDYAPETRQSYRAALRSFFTWAVDYAGLPASPADRLPGSRIPRRRPRPLPEAHYAATQPHTDADKLAMLLAGASGLRRGELAGIHRRHFTLDPDGWTLTVTGKGGDTRTVPVPDGAAALLPTSWLYPSPVAHRDHLTPQAVGQRLSKLLPDGWTTHSLRHRAATRAYATTRDLRAVQELLGHSSPATTAIYTAVPQDALRRAVNDNARAAC